MRKSLLILIILFIGSMSYAREGAADMKKVVMVIASNNFRDEEFFQPKKILEQAGVSVKVASSIMTTARGMLGGEVEPDMTIGDININEYNAIIFVGGSGASEYWDDPVAHRLARQANSAGKIVAAICIAPVTLANAGILAGKNATVWAAEADRLTAREAHYTGKSLEKDGNIITANGPAAADEFGQAILKALSTTKQ